MSSPRNDRRIKRPKKSELLPAPQSYLHSGRNPNEDRLVTALLLAGEKLAEPFRHEQSVRRGGGESRSRGLPDGAGFAKPIDLDSSGIIEGCEDLISLCRDAMALGESNAQRVEVLAALHEAMGDGQSLLLLFRGLFPENKPVRSLDADGKPLLSDREVGILREAASDITRNEIASRLGITRHAVNTHFDNIYKKLGVSRPMQAVGRAISMGYLEMDLAGVLRRLAHCAPRNFTALDSIASNIWPDDLATIDFSRRLAETGIALVTLAGMLSYTTASESDRLTYPACALRLIDANGRSIREFGGGLVHCVRGIAVAPPTAAVYGFTPGNLFVTDYRARSYGLNDSAVVEFTPDGSFVREFYGSCDLATRMSSSAGIAFTIDGRLLVASVQLTDGVLEFTDGGKRIKRFADFCPGGITVAADGTIYVVKQSSIGSVIKALDPAGNELNSFGEIPQGCVYGSLAADNKGHLFAKLHPDTLLKFRSSGEELERYPLPAHNGFGLALGPDGNLIMPLSDTQNLLVVSPTGRIVRRIDTGGRAVHAIAPAGEPGALWLSVSIRAGPYV